MNILFLTNQLTTGGAEHFAVRLSNELASRGHRILVASEGGEIASHLDPAIPHRYAPARAKSPWGMRRLVNRLKDILEGQAIDLIHANSQTTALAARFARLGRPIPIIASAHGVWQGWTKPGVAALFSLGADRIVGCSQALTQDLIRNGLDPRKAETIHNGIPFHPKNSDPSLRALVRSELGIEPNRPIILTVARLANQKGIKYLLASLPLILEEHPEVLLLLAGDGPQREKLEHLAVQLHLEKSVRFLGNQANIERLLCCADLFCLPSISEGLPLSIAEAMAASLPVVATSVGGVPEIVQDGTTGFLVPPGVPAMLGKRIARLLAAPEKLRQMGEAGRGRVASHFTLDHMTSRFEALYRGQLDEASWIKL